MKRIRMGFIGLGGTKGCFQGEPFELFFADKAGEETRSWFNGARRTAAAERYRHPLWNKFGPAVRELGEMDRCTKFFSGHGGVDYIMEMSWIHSLRNGRPMPQNVYDLASWSSIVELSRQSVEDYGVLVNESDVFLESICLLLPQGSC